MEPFFKKKRRLNSTELKKRVEKTINAERAQIWTTIKQLWPLIDKNKFHVDRKMGQSSIRRNSRENRKSFNKMIQINLLSAEKIIGLLMPNYISN